MDMNCRECVPQLMTVGCVRFIMTVEYVRVKFHRNLFQRFRIGQIHTPETDECFEIRKPRKLTEKEVYILKGFKAMGYEYIAVDMTQNVYGFKTAPAKYGYSWYSSDDSQYMCNIAYFFRGVISDGDKKATSIDWLLENKE